MATAATAAHLYRQRPRQQYRAEERDVSQQGMFGETAPNANTSGEIVLEIKSHNGNLSAELNDVMIALGRIGETLQRCLSAAQQAGGREPIEYYTRLLILETQDFRKKALMVIK